MTAPITRTHRLAVARAWEGSDEDGFRQKARRWVETGKATCEDSAGFERLAQLVADAEGAWTFTTGKPEDLPDSDEQVMAISREGDRVLVWLEFTDDSEGHGEPYWRADGGDLALCNYPYWRPLPKDPEQP